MSSPSSQSRSSIDLGTTRNNPAINTEASQHIQLHPPRLQHSPSLPNIWIPPHSGPIPPEFVGTTRDGLYRPSTPPSGSIAFPSPVPPASPTKIETHPPPTPKIQPQKTQRRRRIERDHSHSLLTPPLTPSSSIRTTASIDSSAADAHPNDSALQLGPPGQKSQTRERFLFIETAGRPRPRSVSAGHDASPFAPSPPPTSSTNTDASPTYFYTSPPTSPSTNIYPRMEIHNAQGHRVPNHLFLDDVGNPYPIDRDQQERIESERPQSPGLDTGDTRSQWIGDSHDPNFHCYSSQHDCYYCPSRGPVPVPYGNYGTCPTLPSLSSPVYNPSPRSPHPNVLFPISPSSPSGFMTPNMRNWSFELPLMVSPGNTLGPGAPPSADYWFPDTQGMLVPGLQSAMYYSQHLQTPQGLVPYYPPQPSKLQAPAQRDHSTQGHPIYLSHSHPPSPPSPAHQFSPQIPTASGTREPVVPPERNQLNLARIEDGQDTRTTVMIKNIPNKMSDKDLVLYISKVCPRKIDFLYLRMDFQNGCNVGYAFVNFINVQDLLFFAKKKLGEKWNMFSSEKVLQMSYANYQGKEALVEKFKNSCIMDEREAWRPKIFHSEPGPEQGLPEPFPAPTHLRRKERSSYNRGALYVPGTGTGMQGAQNSQSSSRRTQQGERHQQRVRESGESQGYTAAYMTNQVDENASTFS